MIGGERRSGIRTHSRRRRWRSARGTAGDRITGISIDPAHPRKQLKPSMRGMRMSEIKCPENPADFVSALCASPNATTSIGQFQRLRIGLAQFGVVIDEKDGLVFGEMVMRAQDDPGRAAQWRRLVEIPAELAGNVPGDARPGKAVGSSSDERRERRRRTGEILAVVGDIDGHAVAIGHGYSMRSGRPSSVESILEEIDDDPFELTRSATTRTPASDLSLDDGADRSTRSPMRRTIDHGCDLDRATAGVPCRAKRARRNRPNPGREFDDQAKVGERPFRLLPIEIFGGILGKGPDRGDRLIDFMRGRR